ncbi:MULTISPECIES: TetR/AcrR family transcriptional regulator [unclassified Arthrobacter]|uniref:TetR/AcrR family transcriptional regulator n=1 Tax=unclassified Arthrobacter TaxID=235627 RepID=UPI001F2F53A3|nr:TetR/AcrR family transcriptional regulator [Arthrobacter sp. FW306-06-A]UKA72292.1 TetR/AcrR family transcriptional regulator [Arthrobacter sp. FW306-06-A]
MGPAVNGAPPRPRSYDARRRQEAAEESRKRVLAQSRELFLAHGYGRTTIAAIAHAAGVSKESVYKGFGGKPGLVRAIYAQSLLGAGGPPAEERSDRAQATVTDPRELMEQFGRFIAEVSPLGSPVYLLIRDAAASGDQDMAALLRDVDDERYQRMLHNAHQVLGRGFLRPGLTAEEVADVFFMSTSAELYETLVLKRGWTAERFGVFMARTLGANLLPDGNAASAKERNP